MIAFFVKYAILDCYTVYSYPWGRIGMSVRRL
ncbi:hypothetical protein PRI8871_03649 [Pseudoprimorskyibacter insulae]|uniref:Uncharacterized protein n=1 Tax=Pseudoprimorskyibacter insulae TaxID=1695997 RepID=A0A2R8B0Y5_9RHOB|nr:hypothetical protein PRI8871_03649 [Pseudoprimorskyibacter insulae]